MLQFAVMSAVHFLERTLRFDRRCDSWRRRGGRGAVIVDRLDAKHPQAVLVNLARFRYLDRLPGWEKCGDRVEHQGAQQRKRRRGHEADTPGVDHTEGTHGAFGECSEMITSSLSCCGRIGNTLCADAQIASSIKLQTFTTRQVCY